jgi:TatA/E family protein of Tat protein translocase
MLGVGKIFIILLVALVLFGHKLPKLKRDLGRAIRNFKRETKGIMEVLREKTGR